MREATTICPAPSKLIFGLLTLKVVTCDVGYHCANFSLLKPLCPRLRPDVRDRQTDVRRQTRIIALCPYRRGGSITLLRYRIEPQEKSYNRQSRLTRTANRICKSEMHCY